MANVQQAAVVCTEEQRQQLIELRERLLKAPSPDGVQGPLASSTG